MSKDCNIIEDINKRLESGEDIEDLVPYDLSHASEDVRNELLMLYIKYGKNENRLEHCRKVLGL